MKSVRYDPLALPNRGTKIRVMTSRQSELEGRGKQWARVLLEHQIQSGFHALAPTTGGCTPEKLLGLSIGQLTYRLEHKLPLVREVPLVRATRNTSATGNRVSRQTRISGREQLVDRGREELLARDATAFLLRGTRGRC